MCGGQLVSASACISKFAVCRRSGGERDPHLIGTVGYGALGFGHGWAAARRRGKLPAIQTLEGPGMAPLPSSKMLAGPWPWSFYPVRQHRHFMLVAGMERIDLDV